MQKATVQSSPMSRIGELFDTLLAQQIANPRDRDIFRLRVQRHFNDCFAGLAALYAQHSAWPALLEQLAERLVAAYAQRRDALKIHDLAREIEPDWFAQARMVGGIYYVDRLAGTLRGVIEHLDYLQDLGLTYVHLMPLLQPRYGPNDGGYAVQDYRAINRELGSIADFVELSDLLRANGMSVCIDVVVNHTAKEHEWALKARAGDPTYLDYYLSFADRSLPDAYEQHLPEVFPDFAPGNFTWYPELGAHGRWIWTTFNEFQWDLNYANPMVWLEMLDILLYLANLGVDVLRLDAVPFMWKRLGTNCQNQPEVLDLLQAWRAAMRIVCPATIFKAEAIVAPDDLVQYLGLGQRTGKLCEIAYHNSLMVLLWSGLASQRADLLTQSLLNMPATAGNATWITYVRCHDDIGWAITDQNAALVGEDGPLHRQFLSAWYRGEFAGSFARGEVFQYNPITNDRRISGMTASLAGLEQALANADPTAIELAIRRIALLYAVIFGFGGIPLIYMGDELGMLNDHSYLNDPCKANDNRWLHRPAMNWALAAQRHDPTTLAGRLWHLIRNLITIRQQTPALHSAGQTIPIWTQQRHVLGVIRVHPLGRILILGNLSAEPQRVALSVVREAGLAGNLHNLLEPTQLNIDVQRAEIVLDSYQCCWLCEPAKNF
ncbi:alpha-amylase family protein [Herpetosiphon giganteus]|uniref:alpha-amylase family protein n=1 Tax=Herpetosiphon giganteus TaxID=2029754 RepID=UPI001956C9D6|nr:alpha-amylase family protein [Herpetosiphon giganteus]MBM7842365.1 amylosucrase [Herpetosiphon giganteus]